MHVLVQYLITEGPKHIPNIEIFINGVVCENRRNRPPKDLRESTEYIVAKGAKGGEMFIQELRCDVRKEAIDIYDHIDKKELREATWLMYRSRHEIEDYTKWMPYYDSMQPLERPVALKGRISSAMRITLTSL